MKFLENRKENAKSGGQPTPRLTCYVGAVGTRVDADRGDGTVFVHLNRVVELELRPKRGVLSLLPVVSHSTRFGQVAVADNIDCRTPIRTVEPRHYIIDWACRTTGRGVLKHARAYTRAHVGTNASAQTAETACCRIQEDTDERCALRGAYLGIQI